jgi:hypothetical protein
MAWRGRARRLATSSPPRRSYSCCFPDGRMIAVHHSSTFSNKSSSSSRRSSESRPACSALACVRSRWASRMHPGGRHRRAKGTYVARSLAVFYLWLTVRRTAKLLPVALMYFGLVASAYDFAYFGPAITKSPLLLQDSRGGRELRGSTSSSSQRGCVLSLGSPLMRQACQPRYCSRASRRGLRHATGSDARSKYSEVRRVRTSFAQDGSWRTTAHGRQACRVQGSRGLVYYYRNIPVIQYFVP